MEILLLRPQEFQRLYNCSRINIDDIPLKDRQHPVEAILLIILSTIYYLLYVPCVYGIWKHAGWQNACYTLLLYISICDLSILWIIGHLHGWLALNGAVFCSCPLLCYLTGLIACEVLWAMESTADLILALNRCIDAVSPEYSSILFGGYRIYCWLLVPTFYGLYNLFFAIPAVYSNSIWFFNPYIGYIPDTKGIYSNYLHSAHNIFIAIANPIVYVLFMAAMLVKMRKYGDASANGTSYSTLMNSVFLQVFTLSALNTVASSIYIYMQYVSAPEVLMLIGHFAWLHIHGLPPVIFLLLNPTIRNESKTFCAKIFGQNMVNSVSRASNRVSVAVTAHAQNSPP